MPKLRADTVDAHRRTVRDAVCDAAWALVAERGVRGVTMSHVAERAGIGRATLYRYFPDVEAVLVACHQRMVAGHVAHLRQLADAEGDEVQGLVAVLRAYALMRHRAGRQGTAEVSALVHREPHVGAARDELLAVLRELIERAARSDRLRTDVGPGELAGYCLHALEAAGSADSEEAVHRLVGIVVSGLGGTDPARS